MGEHTPDFNFNQLTPPTSESFNELIELTGGMMALSEELGQVGTSKSRGTNAISGCFDGANTLDIICTNFEYKYPGEAAGAESQLSLSFNGKMYKDATDQLRYATAMNGLREVLPPETMSWVKKVMAEIERANNPDFTSFAVNDLLDQAPSIEQLIANNPGRMTDKNVHRYAVPVFDHDLQYALLHCKNKADISYSFAEGNETYWKHNPDEETAQIQVRTADGRHFMYLRFSDGSERLTVEASDWASQETRASLREAGATLVEEAKDLARPADVRHGVQAPNNTTMQLMNAELRAAMVSGADERYFT